MTVRPSILIFGGCLSGVLRYGRSKKSEFSVSEFRKPVPSSLNLNFRKVLESSASFR
jgi:hypothetical protein